MSWFMKQSPHNWEVFHPLYPKQPDSFIAHLTEVWSISCDITKTSEMYFWEL